MKSNFFSILKIAVVIMMLAWAVKYARAQDYQDCPSPVHPVEWGSCINACFTELQRCGEGDPYCQGQFNACAYNCYENYCI